METLNVRIVIGTLIYPLELYTVDRLIFNVEENL